MAGRDRQPEGRGAGPAARLKVPSGRRTLVATNQEPADCRAWPLGHDQIVRTHQRDAAHSGEPGFAEPGRILFLAVRAAVGRSDEHVDGEQCARLRRSLLGVHDVVLDDYPPGWSQRVKRPPEEIAVLGGAEHVADRREQHQVVAGSERVSL